MKKLIDVFFITGCIYLLAGCAVQASLSGNAKEDFLDLSHDYFESCRESDPAIDYETAAITRVCYLPNRCEIDKTVVSCVSNHATIDKESIVIQVNDLEPVTPEEAYPDMSGGSL